jgi:CelD/BcsL family acetyltransferase involved in cellulose biosynthesis
LRARAERAAKASVPRVRAPTRVVAIDDPQALARHLAAWDDLVENALEPNPFHEPWLFLPAVENLAPGRKLALLLVYGEAPAGGERLIGFFPLERLWHYRGLPLRVLRFLRHEVGYLCTPLVRRGCPRECLESFFQWVTEASGVALLELHGVAGEGPFHQALIYHFERHSHTVFFSDRYTRALFRPRASAEDYLQAALPGRSRKEFRRLTRRLAEQGRLEYRFLTAQDNSEAWIQSFLELERRGWKGRVGTALASTPARRRFFEAIARAAIHRERLTMHGLYLDGHAVALSCKILAGDGAFAFKIAFDEAYDQFSPGALLELEHIVRMHQNPRIRWMDSCASSGHFMANRLWLDRRTMETITVATGRPGGLVVLLLPLLRWVSRRLRALLWPAS